MIRYLRNTGLISVTGWKPSSKTSRCGETLGISLWDRAEKAFCALKTHADRNDGLPDNPEDFKAELTDLVTDIMHLCDASGVDALYVLRAAENHWTEERPQSAEG